MKVCSECKVPKVLTSFSKNSKRKDEKCGKCKECQKLWRKENISRLRLQRTAYTEKNLEKSIFYNAKARAKKYDLNFSIELSDIVIPEVCPVLGIRLQRSSEKRSPGSPSIDRIDCSKGYIKGNIAIVSWRTNQLKWNGTIEEIEKILNYMKEGLK